MPTPAELTDILLRKRLLDQETANARALQARAGMQTGGPISPDQLQAMVAQSQMRQRMGVDPQAARFRAMLANPAQPQGDPYADTPEDTARKAALARLTLINGKRIPTGEVPQSLMDDMRGQERGKWAPGSDQMQQRSRRQMLGNTAAAISRAKSADLAFRRGVLNPTAETAYAAEGVIPDRQAAAVAQRIAMAQAMQHPANVDPMKAIMARWLSDPANMDKFMKSRMGGEDAGAAPVDPAEAPGVHQIPGGTTTILPGGGRITRRKPNFSDKLGDLMMQWGDYVNSANAMSGPARGF